MIFGNLYAPDGAGEAAPRRPIWRGDHQRLGAGDCRAPATIRKSRRVTLPARTIGPARGGLRARAVVGCSTRRPLTAAPWRWLRPGRPRSRARAGFRPRIADRTGRAFEAADNSGITLNNGDHSSMERGGLGSSRAYGRVGEASRLNDGGMFAAQRGPAPNVNRWDWQQGAASLGNRDI